MRHLTPAARALLQHQANEHVRLAWACFLWFALFFIIGAVLLFHRHEIKRHWAKLLARAERNRTVRNCAPLLVQSTNRVLDEEKAA